jgi:hypothetical protein
MPFPEGSADDDVDELHADLALVDTWIAEAIVPFVDEGVIVPVKVDPLAALHEINARATRLAISTSAGDKKRLEQYLRYAEALREAYEAFLTAIRPQ